MKTVEEIVAHLTSELPVVEMRASRGKKFKDTGFYQIRIKPLDLKKSGLNEILDKVKGVMSTLKLGGVKINKSSPNSGKYSSVSFVLSGINHDVVIAQGGNNGERFERELIAKMQNYVNGVEISEDAVKALKALMYSDPRINLKNIKDIRQRTGSTRRSFVDLAETGKVIADMIITLKDGSEEYVSIKDDNGVTVGQLGCAKAFNKDNSVNTDSEEWKSWLAPFGLDADKITGGLDAYQSQQDVAWSIEESGQHFVTRNDPIYGIMQRMWGMNYSYLKRTSNGEFVCVKVDSHYLDKSILKNLMVTKIKYPYKGRKHIGVSLESEGMNFSIEIREAKGRPGHVIPSQIQLKVAKYKM